LALRVLNGRPSCRCSCLFGTVGFVAVALRVGAASSSAAPAHTAALDTRLRGPDDHTSWYPDRPDATTSSPRKRGPRAPIVSRKDYHTSRTAPRLRFLPTTYASRSPSIRSSQPWVSDRWKRDNDMYWPARFPLCLGRDAYSRRRVLPGGIFFLRRVAHRGLCRAYPSPGLIICRATISSGILYDVPHSARPPAWFGDPRSLRRRYLVVRYIGQEHEDVRLH